MRCQLTPFGVRAALVVLLVTLPATFAVDAARVRHLPRPLAKTALPRSSHAWTLDEALASLEVSPNDAYVQYVALQLARRAGRSEDVVNDVARLSRRDPGRGADVNLFDLFTGALAVQESLQLDTMRGAAERGPAKKSDKQVAVAALSGPTVTSHPWKKMLAGKKPAVSPMARLVPEDFYLVEFRSVKHLFEIMDVGDLWSREMFGQVSRDARTYRTGPRLRQQLLVSTGGLGRILGDTLIQDVAVTGSDLLLSEGSDVTVLFRAKKPEAFKAVMDNAIAAAAKSRSDAKSGEGEYLGVKYTHLTTPQRDIHVFSAYPEPDLHVRSNSEVGLKRVLEAIKGKTPMGETVRRLGDTEEYAYIRTLMPRGAKEEDGFIYLSDPFIRKLVGPRFKLAARRRCLCYNHLRMIGHAATMYRTEFGVAANSLDDLAKAECCPGAFNKDNLVCVDGGTYTLSADGNQGICSRHGHPHQLVPCCETAPDEVSAEEAEAYKTFVRDYSQYWRTFFDPIALRIAVTPERYRLETIVLPLIDNTVYRTLEATFHGKPEPLDALPVPRRNILSVAGRFNKEALLERYAEDLRQGRKSMVDVARNLGVPGRAAEAVDVVELLDKGLGNQVGFNMYDAASVFDLDVTNLFGLMLGNFNGGPGRSRGFGGEEVWISFVIASINSPVYLSLPVRDEKIVDKALDQIDEALVPLARRGENLFGGVRLDRDFYRTRLESGPVIRSFAFRIGPITWRLHWGRIGRGLYIASKPFILEDLAKAAAEAPKALKEKTPKADADATAHVMLRIRPRNWDRVLPGYRLNWSENNREACLRNLGPIASAGRATLAWPGGDTKKPDKVDGAERIGKALRFANQLYAVGYFCPGGGQYALSADGKTCSCSVHGTLTSPEQGLAPQGGARAPVAFSNVTAALTFLDDGLHAVLVLERK